MGKIFTNSFDEERMDTLTKHCWEHVLTPREIDSWRHAIQLDKRRREKCIWVALTGKECDKHKQKDKMLQKLKNMITQER